MTYELITTRNMTEGFHVLFQYSNDTTGGLFIRLFLLTFYIVIALGMYFNQKRLTGYDDGAFPKGMAVAGFSTIVLTTLLRMIPNLVDVFTYAVVLIVGTISVLWFFFSKK